MIELSLSILKTDKALIMKMVCIDTETDKWTVRTENMSRNTPHWQYGKLIYNKDSIEIPGERIHIHFLLSSWAEDLNVKVRTAKYLEDHIKCSVLRNIY